MDSETAAGRTQRPASGSYTLEELLARSRAAFLRDGIPKARTRIEIGQALDEDFGTRPADASTTGSRANPAEDGGNTPISTRGMTRTTSPPGHSGAVVGIGSRSPLV